MPDDRLISCTAALDSDGQSGLRLVQPIAESIERQSRAGALLAPGEPVQCDPTGKGCKGMRQPYFIGNNIKGFGPCPICSAKRRDEENREKAAIQKAFEANVWRTVQVPELCAHVSIAVRRGQVLNAVGQPFPDDVAKIRAGGYFLVTIEEELNLVQTLRELRKGWCVIGGPKGRGKTHLAAAWLLDLAREGMDCYFLDMKEMALALRSKFDSELYQQSTEMLSRARRATYCVVDDLGFKCEKPNGYSRQILDATELLIAMRHKDGKPTVITTNHGSKELERMLDEAIYSRVAEMTDPPTGGGWWWLDSGYNRRLGGQPMRGLNVDR